MATSPPPSTARAPSRRRSGGLRAWWRRHWWIVLTSAGVLAFVLAFVGGDDGFLSRLNTALKILPVGFGIEANESTSLQVARIIAPLVFAYATFKAVGVLFSERLQDVRAGLRKDHTIVCGLGRRGQTLTESLLGSKKVVALEIDPANPAVRRLRDEGAVVLVGDATDPEALARAGVGRAAHVVAVCSQDAVNAQIAAHVLDQAHGRTDRPVGAFVHVGDPRLYTFLLHHSFATPGTWLEFFNVYERGATGLLRETESLRSGDHPVLVLGAGQFGLALISQLARERNEGLAEDPGAGPLRVYLVDRQATARAAVLTERYSRFRDVCDLHAFELDVDSPAFDRLLQENPELAEVGMAFVCFDDDALTIASALNLLAQGRGRFVVSARVSDRSEGIAGLIQEAQSTYADTSTFQPISVAERACRADLVLDGMRGQLARNAHDVYRRGQHGTPDDVPWEELPDEGRKRNLSHADGIARQLEAVGYRLGPLIDWGAAPLELSPEDVERMSELEHERWMDEKLAAGWRYGPTRNDVELVHPDLVPWAELPDDRREIDREFVRERPKMLARVGIQIYRT